MASGPSRRHRGSWRRRNEALSGGSASAGPVRFRIDGELGEASICLLLACARRRPAPCSGPMFPRSRPRKLSWTRGERKRFCKARTRSTGASAATAEPRSPSSTARDPHEPRRRDARQAGHGPVRRATRPSAARVAGSGRPRDPTHARRGRTEGGCAPLAGIVSSPAPRPTIPEIWPADLGSRALCSARRILGRDRVPEGSPRPAETERHHEAGDAGRRGRSLSPPGPRAPQTPRLSVPRRGHIEFRSLQEHRGLVSPVPSRITPAKGRGQHAPMTTAEKGRGDTPARWPSSAPTTA